MADENSLARKVQKVKVSRVIRPEDIGFNYVHGNCDYGLFKVLLILMNNRPIKQRPYDPKNSRRKIYHRGETD